MHLSTVSPQYNSSWALLVSYKKHFRIPSAILFSGLPSIGKNIFAKQFAKYILCEQVLDLPCESCRSCLFFDAGSHPDYTLLESDEGSRQIKIEQIRDLTHTLGQTSGFNAYQVALISKAEDMNKAAANALLKTLEEPQGRVVILLISDQPSLILPTVRSRCQHIKLEVPLNALDGIQLQKLALRDSLLVSLKEINADHLNPSKLAETCLADIEEVIELLITVVMDIIKIKFYVQAYINHQDKVTELSQLGRGFAIQHLFQLLTILFEARELLLSRSNVNLQLLMEKIFIYWQRMPLKDGYDIS